MANSSWVLLVLVLFSSSTLEASRILLAPIPSGSHVMNFQQVGEALISAGHEVHIVMDQLCRSTTKLAKANIKLHTYDTGCIVEQPEMEARREATLFREVGTVGMFAMATELKQMSRKYTEVIFSNKTLFDELRSYNFDLCIVDGLLLFRFLYMIPYKLDIPIASFLTVFNSIDAGIPALPSFTPMINFGKYTDDMTFKERAMNALHMFVFDGLMTLVNPYLRGGWVVSEFAPEKPAATLTDIASNTELWLIQNDVALDYPQVRLPHVVDIGGLNARPPNPLAKNFQALMDGATNGVVIVSFGSMVRGFTAEISNRLLNELTQLKQTVIWRHDGKNIAAVPPHVHLVDWLPQNDLLGHPNTKAFVTHCGSNGQFEALYNAVPMVGLPIFADQLYNARRIEKHGLGIHLDLHHFKPGELLTAIEEVINNDAYKINITRRAQIFHDRPMTPKATLVYWVEHILKYGSGHLRSIAIKMPWYTYWCVDLLVCLLVTVLLVSFVVYTLTRCAVKMICRRIQGKEHAAVKIGGKEKEQ